MKTQRSITRWLTATCLLFAGAFAGCGRDVSPYTTNEAVRLEQGQPAPFAGWLLCDADLETLLKLAQAADGE